MSEWRRGWPVVAAGAVGMAVGAALYQYVSSLFIPSLQTAFHWSRGDIASAAAIGLLAALSAPLIGMLADRFGVRIVAGACLCAVALAHIGFASMTGELWQFMACVAVLSAVGPGCSSLAFSRAVNGWFDQSRGLALGLMACGISIGTLLASPLLAWTIATHGFRAGYLVLAALAALIGIPVVLTGISDGPHTGARADASLPDTTLATALRSAPFWLLAVIMFIVNACAAGVLTQLAPLLGDKHMPPGVITALIATFAASVLFGRLAIGWLFDRVEAKRVAAIVTAASAAGALLLLGSAPSIAQTALAVFLIGLMQGAETDVLAYFVARLFGIHAYNRVYGVLVTISLLGTAAGIVGFGRLYDAAGDYELALTISAAALALTTALYFLMPYLKAARGSEQ